MGYHGHAKLAYHALRMAYQPILAGSRNVDLVYGPKDRVPATVMHLGPGKTVNLTVTTKTLARPSMERLWLSTPIGKCVCQPATAA
jgi:hypothetical protein